MEDVVLVSHNAGWGLRLKQVRKLTIKTLREQYSGPRALVSLVFVGKSRAKKYNQDYRKMDYVPQVLGFPMGQEVDSDGLVRLGDILICTPLLKEEAILLNKKLVDVLEDWLRHGVSNLLKPSPGTVTGLVN